MIYLLSQVLPSLLLATLLGGALGWLAHRARAGAALQALRGELAQRTRLLTEARGDVQMLGDDFEELRTRSREEIDALRAENRELPTLAANLEKSQLMVRQLMQRHDAASRELTARNEELAEQLATLRAQADLRERAHAELESARLRESGGGDTLDSPGSGSPTAPDPLALDPHASDDPAGPDPATTPPPRSWASRRLDRGDGEGEGERVDVADDTDGGEALDELMEVDADLAAELQDDPIDASHLPGDAASGGIGLGTLGAGARFHAGAVTDTVDVDMGDADADGTDVDAGAEARDAQRLASTDEPSRPGAVGDEEEDETGYEDDEANATLAIDILPADLELAFDLDERDAPLFDPVDHQDDLQRLFGIGPITEKALNTLGITSYSQLAELERHEIEKIADALQIVPERIEKDDWVGNARRQLEDVLEQL